MSKPRVLVAGLNNAMNPKTGKPLGEMAKLLLTQFIMDDRFDVIPVSLSGPELKPQENTIGSVPEPVEDVKTAEVEVDGMLVQLVHPQHHEQVLVAKKNRHGDFIVVDATCAAAVNPNAELYSKLDLPFVMLTTMGDREKLHNTVIEAGNTAVISANMGGPIVGFIAAMKFIAETYPGLFSGFTLEIRESHQSGKEKVSGTAAGLVEYFNMMGLDFSIDQIKMIRDVEEQKRMGVPPEHLDGHGWHTYILRSQDGTVFFQFTHNVNGRLIYWEGTAKAVLFLHNMMIAGVRGYVFSMPDVLRGFDTVMEELNA